LVPTKDNVLVAIHSLDLNITTDVERKFPDRAKFDIEGLGDIKSGYLTTDFTLEEIKTLRVRQRLEDTPARSRLFDYQFTIPTFQEILELVLHWNQDILPYIDRAPFKKEAGVYVELKHPKFISEYTNRSLNELFLGELRQNQAILDYFFNSTMCENIKFDEYVRPPIIVQSFDSDALISLHQIMQTDNVFNSSLPPMVQLISKNTCRRPEFWFEISQLSNIEGIGPDKDCLLNGEDALGFVQEAIKRGLVVHPWTERLEVEFLSEKYNNAEEELTHLFCDLKIHGMFFENVGLGRKIVEKPCDLVKEIEMEKEGNIDVVEEEKIAEVICEDRVGADFMKQFLMTVAGLLIGACLGGMGMACSYKTPRDGNNKMHAMSSTTYKSSDFTIDDDENEIL